MTAAHIELIIPRRNSFFKAIIHRLLQKFQKRKAVVREKESEKGITFSLSQSILDTLSPHDVVYAEFDCCGNMKYTGRSMLYLIKDEKLLCYETDRLKEIGPHVVEWLITHQRTLFNDDTFYRLSLKSDSRWEMNKATLADLDTSGFGNHVFVNKKYKFEVRDKISDKYLVYMAENKEHLICPSTPVRKIFFDLFDLIITAMNGHKKKRSVISYLNPELKLDESPLPFGEYEGFGGYEISWDELLQSEIVLSPKDMSKTLWDGKRWYCHYSHRDIRCLKCLKEQNGTQKHNNEHMIGVHYKSCEMSGPAIAGREGYMLICTKHNKRIYFHLTFKVAPPSLYPPICLHS